MSAKWATFCWGLIVLNDISFPSTDAGVPWLVVFLIEGMSQKQVSRAGTSNYIPQYLWDIITCPCPWYLLLAHNFWIHSSVAIDALNWIELNFVELAHNLVQFIFENCPHYKRLYRTHDDFIKWKHFPCYWPFVGVIRQSPVTIELPSQRPLMRSFDVFFDLRCKRLSKKSRRHWFETPSSWLSL